MLYKIVAVVVEMVDKLIYRLMIGMGKNVYKTRERLWIVLGITRSKKWISG
jgi:hypothetical protein